MRNRSSSTQITLTNQHPEPILLQQPEDSNRPWARQAYIGECTIIKGLLGYRYGVWTITIETYKGSKITIYRRYLDFERLSNNLKQYYPEVSAQIPPLPSKNRWGMLQGPWSPNFDPNFLRRRRQGLEYFLNAILLNTVFSQSLAVQEFIVVKK